MPPRITITNAYMCEESGESEATMKEKQKKIINMCLYTGVL